MQVLLAKGSDKSLIGKEKTGEVVMIESTKNAAEACGKEPAAKVPSSADAATVGRQRRQERQEARRWWIKLFVQPALMLTGGAILIAGLGVAQRQGFISASGGSAPRQALARIIHEGLRIEKRCVREPLM
jgi:hypothetical protein